ncbi:MAG: 50S ribosomal protein L21 [Candidatus Limnocylindrales bacterium]
MYAVIESGGKQHRVELGSEIQVDRLDVQPGDSITLDRVLLVADGDDAAIGQPVVDGASVSAQVLRQERGDKIVVFKYKPKARTRVKQGFRAELTTLRITDIALGGKSAAKDAEKAEKADAKRAREAAAAEQAAADKAAADKAAADKALAERLATAEATAPKTRSKKSSAKPSATAGAAPAPEAEIEATGDSESPSEPSIEPSPEAEPEAAVADAEESKKDE